MDLSVNQEVTRVCQRFEAEYGNHVFNLQEAYKETDITGNNNFLNSLKTETSSDHAHDPTPLFQDNYSDDKDFRVDNSLFSYSSFKKAMDLRIHNRTVDGGKRSIFDDAEYFARNCCYKLLPITFEQVDETIIHTEHNYSLCSLDSESEPEEDCSRTMDYSQIRQKNYKKRKNKCRESNDRGETVFFENCQDDSSLSLAHPDVGYTQQPQDQSLSPSSEQENPFAGQPLDLSAVPLVQEEKTEPLSSASEEAVSQPDSDKENVSAKLSGIRVTITRPDEKENYQPCDLFLNDIARLVPWLIDKDCFEVDILDRTCDRHDEFRKHRLYYVIAESTWRSFQSTNERMILTNDRSLGQPLRKAEKGERPSFLVFDQLSLAKCLADYCQEIGGCFEYTCVEEDTGGGCLEEKPGMIGESVEKEMEAREVVEPEEIKARSVKGVERAADEGRNRGELKEGEGGGEDEVEKVEKKRIVREEEEKQATKAVETMMDESVGSVREAGVGGRDESREGNEVDTSGELQKSKCSEEALETAEKVVAVELPQPLYQASRYSVVEDVDEVEYCSNSSTKKASEKRGRKARRGRSKPKNNGKKSPNQPKPKNSRITTRSMSTSEFETSQKSDKRVSKQEGRKRRNPTPPRQEPPNKRRRISKPQEVVRSRRSATLSQRAEVKTEKTAAKKRSEKNENGIQKDSGKREAKGKRVSGRGNLQNTGRNLRSGAQEKVMPTSSRKAKKR